MISLYSFLLLVKTRLVVHGSFGGELPLLRLRSMTGRLTILACSVDMGGILYGKYMRWAILFSIVLSQVSLIVPFLFSFATQRADPNVVRRSVSSLLILSLSCVNTLCFLARSTRRSFTRTELMLLPITVAKPTSLLHGGYQLSNFHLDSSPDLGSTRRFPP